MDSKLLGQRIKEARLAKKMTQNEVVGSFITRNMLSQIESGNAVPSMKTLTYLAKVLELPPSVLLQDTPEEHNHTLDQNNTQTSEAPPEALALYKAKEAYLAGDHATAQSTLASIPMDSLFIDEAYALSARVALQSAEAQCKQGNYTEALELAKAAEVAASKGIYASLELKSQALLLLSDAAAKLASATH